LAWAVREERILLTFDKEFGELASKSALPPECGAVLLRTPMPKARDTGQRLASLITARTDWTGYVACECDRLNRSRGGHWDVAHRTTKTFCS
jgi:hypothetical protein